MKLIKIIAKANVNYIFLFVKKKMDRINKYRDNFSKRTNEKYVFNDFIHNWYVQKHINIAVSWLLQF